MAAAACKPTAENALDMALDDYICMAGIEDPDSVSDFASKTKKFLKPSPKAEASRPWQVAESEAAPWQRPRRATKKLQLKHADASAMKDRRPSRTRPWRADDLHRPQTAPWRAGGPLTLKTAPWRAARVTTPVSQSQCRSSQGLGGAVPATPASSPTEICVNAIRVALEALQLTGPQTPASSGRRRNSVRCSKCSHYGHTRASCRLR